ncbi:glycoside hydrolase family 13 protein [Gynuella sunshinyii]|uniref:Glycosidase n=1 Tax=Gynuella sunshinyii YC6258 TaxID=1445510 RepID=A0A0C5VX97_9GAMM|nr:alpha-glucosidase [Gynuella sunshinyii]AJQ95059.1 glycosidase [Gynuella sunshinyii YC6258]
MKRLWWHDAVVYQIYPRSFMDSNNDGIGDIPGIISKLDYLAELGVDVLWLSPVFKSPMDDNGYDISDYDDIAPEFGTLADMDRLIEQAGQRGIRILLDLVVNHSSDEHPWFQQARQSKDNPYRDFYIWRQPRADGSPPNQLRAAFAGSAWELDEATGEYYLHLFSKKQPDLNWQNPKVRTEVYAMMNRWLDRGIAGFRMDVIEMLGKIPDQEIIVNGPDLHPILQEMHQQTLAGRDTLTVGETWAATTDIAKLYSSPERKELSMVFGFDHIRLSYHPQAGKWRPKPFDLVELKQVFAHWQTELAGEGWNSLFWNNHDLARSVSIYGDEGEYRLKSAKMLATVIHGMQGTPYIYQGEEIGMTNVRFEHIEDYQDIETRNHYVEKLAEGYSHDELMTAIHTHSRDNARTPMQWDGSEYAGFSEASPWIKVNPNYQEINVQQDQQRQDSLFRHYQQLIRLRKSWEILVYGSFELILSEHPTVFAYLRHYQDQTLLVVNSFARENVTVELPAIWQNRSCETLITNDKARQQLSETLQLTPYESFMVILSQH